MSHPTRVMGFGGLLGNAILVLKLPARFRLLGRIASSGGAVTT